MKKITLHGKVALKTNAVALVDDRDFEWLNSFRWSYTTQGYVARGVWDGDGTVKIRMHRLILGAREGELCDHKNGIRHDNRRSNLRICTHAENMRNRKPNYNSEGGLKGILWVKGCRKWKAAIQANGKVQNIGLFEDKIEAAKAYDAKARELHGKFARTNF